MSTFTIRHMRERDKWAVAKVICLSTSTWYQAHNMGPRFLGGPKTTEFYYDIYHTLPGSYGLVADDDVSHNILGSCFVHERPTHMSLGIMNVHPSYANRGIGSALLRTIVAQAKKIDKPLRLVSSALNLSSFSLYNKQGFVPYCVYQDMEFTVPPDGYEVTLPATLRTREGTLADLDEIVALEREVSGIERPGDYEHFLTNPDGYWHVSVCDSMDGGIDAVMVSVNSPPTTMIGPGCARDAETGSAVLLAELNRFRNRSIVALIPCACRKMVDLGYQLGAKNKELHFTQIIGEIPKINGWAFPTFMPETG
ncbi:MAG: GNAT family N-acetyltransferase [Lentisphaeria bacterium]|jgi:GNAT superfamily N-acetyltransferase